MKNFRLFLLSALWLIGLGASAADLVERTEPLEPDFGPGMLTVDNFTPTAVDFVLGDCYVLFNVGSQAYFSEGNAWGTQASISAETPLLARFTLPEGKTLADNALLFNNYPNTKNTWKLAFFDSDSQMYVDLGSQANYYWQVVAGNGDKTYRLQASPANPTYNPDAYSGFVGLDVSEDEFNTALHPFLEEGEGHYIDWQFFAVPEWTSYFKEKDVYDMSVKLKAQIEAAEAMGVDVSAAVAIYNNMSSTVEQMQAAIQALKDAMAGDIGQGTAENPSNATLLLSNPNFDGASPSGWLGTTPNMVGSGTHGPADVAEHYNKTFDTYQELANLPAGVYRFTAKTFFRGTWADYIEGTNKDCYPYLYALTTDTLKTLFNNAWSPMNTESMAGSTEFGTTAGETSTVYNGVTYFIPNDPSAFRLYAEKGFYDTNLFFEVTEGQARLGVKKDKLEGGSDWAVFDTFTLMYYGNTEASFQKWVELSVPVFNLTEDMLFTQSYLDAYNEAIASQKATNKAEALAAIEALAAVAAELQENINLWNAYKGVVEEAFAMVIDPQYDDLDPALDLGDYCEGDYVEFVDARALTNEELEAEIAKVRQMIQAVKDADAQRLKDGDDVTKFLTNPGFESGSNGWTVVSKGGGNVQLGGNAANHCFEAWHSTDFEVYQEVQNLPVGVYEISVKGYVRYLDGSSAIQAKESQPEDVPIYVYLNDSKTKLANWFDYPKELGYYKSVDASAAVLDDGEYEYPDNMTAASIAFNEGGYQKSAVGLVAQKGDVLRIGVRGTPSTQQFWPIFDDFRLTYRAFNADVVKPALEEALAGIDLNRPMGKSVKEKAVALMAAAEEVMAGDDGKEMFKALSEIFAVKVEIDESVALFVKLQKASESLLEAITNSQAAAATINEAKALSNQIMDGIDDGTLDNADAEELIAQVEVMLVKLGIPANVLDATDDNPADLTGVIRTPSFSDAEGNNSIDGWTATGQKFGNTDQMSALALESWESVLHIYQDIKGLPDGTYTLKVNAWERTASPTYLYGVSGGQTFAKELIKVDEGLPEGVAAPSGLIEAVNMFDENTFMNELIVKVTGEELRIGIRKDENAGGDWVVMDNFQLWYHGTNSQLTPDGDATGIALTEQARQVRTEYFTIDGRRAVSAQKGIMIQKTTLGDGTIVIRKVRK